MKSTPVFKPILAGTFAGASGVAALALILATWLGIGLLWQYAFYISIPVIKDIALPAVIQDVGRLPSFFWSWRWTLLFVAALGAPLAYIDYNARRLPPPFTERLAGVILLGITSVVVIAGLLVQIDQSLYGNLALMRNESLANIRDAQGSVANLILIGGVVALALAGAIWLYWSWWYRHWQRWLRIEMPVVPHSEAMVHPDVWFERRRQRERIRLGTILAFVGFILVAAAGIAGYASVRTLIQSGEVRPTPDAPLAETRLALSRPTRVLVIENTFGKDSAMVTLVDARDGAVVDGPVELTFGDGRLGFDRVEMPVAALPLGDYLLRADAPGGGRVGYALLQSDGTLVMLTAILAGIGIGGAFGVAVLLLGTLVGKSEG